VHIDETFQRAIKYTDFNLDSSIFLAKERRGIVSLLNPAKLTIKDTHTFDELTNIFSKALYRQQAASTWPDEYYGVNQAFRLLMEFHAYQKLKKIHSIDFKFAISNRVIQFQLDMPKLNETMAKLWTFDHNV